MFDGRSGGDVLSFLVCLKEDSARYNLFSVLCCFTDTSHMRSLIRRKFELLCACSIEK